MLSDPAFIYWIKRFQGCLAAAEDGPYRAPPEKRELNLSRLVQYLAE